MEIAHSSDDASASRLYELYAKYVSPDELNAMNRFGAAIWANERGRAQQDFERDELHSGFAQ